MHLQHPTQHTEPAPQPSAATPSARTHQPPGAQHTQRAHTPPLRPLCLAQAAKEAKKAEARKAEEDRKARRRMLGNIIFVGQLYLTGSLTEGVIHTCIRQLLDEVGGGGCLGVDAGGGVGWVGVDAGGGALVEGVDREGARQRPGGWVGAGRMLGSSRAVTVARRAGGWRSSGASPAGTRPWQLHCSSTTGGATLRPPAPALPPHRRPPVPKLFPCPPLPSPPRPQTDNPRPEDVECLCKLMGTVGGPLDASKRVVDKGSGATSSAMMDVYFRWGGVLGVWCGCVAGGRCSKGGWFGG